MPARTRIKQSAVQRKRVQLPVPLQAQPTDSSCGPTCLQAVYAFHKDPIALPRLIAEVPTVEGGGTVAVLLGLHALRRGYDVRLYTNNLRVFDPTWFVAPHADLAQKLRQQIKHRSGKRRHVIQAFLEFVEAGGEVRFEVLNGALIRKHLVRNEPILTGLSATFLYRACREMPDTGEPDDLRGESAGHFVLLRGYRPRRKTVLVADPYEANPMAKGREYEVPMDRLLNSILLGVLTYDANLLVVRPGSR